jgi:hypothetical protein
MSAFLLDEAIKNIKDENAVSLLVGSLEKTLERESSFVQFVNDQCDDSTNSSQNSNKNFGALRE